MKAVVLEIRGKEAVVLTTDGEIIKIKQKNLKTGDTIELSEKQLNGKRIPLQAVLRYGSIAAAAALFMGGAGMYSYNNVMACSYVSLDADTSIEFTLNRKNLVLDVTALDEEAAELVQELKTEGIRKSTLSEAMEKTAVLLEKYGYLDTEATDYVLVNVSCDDEKIRDLLKEEASTVFDDMNGESTETVNATVTGSSISERKNAKALGISSGEYQEIRKIKENETAAPKPEVSADDIDKYGSMGVRELLETSGQLEKKDDQAGEKDGQPEPVAENGQNTAGSERDERGISGKDSNSSTVKDGNETSLKNDSSGASVRNSSGTSAKDSSGESEKDSSEAFVKDNSEAVKNNNEISMEDSGVESKNSGISKGDNAKDSTQNTNGQSMNDQNSTNSTMNNNKENKNIENQSKNEENNNNTDGRQKNIPQVQNSQQPYNPTDTGENRDNGGDF